MKIKCEYTEIVDIEKLTPNPKNPNKHTCEQIKMLAKIMKHQGWRHPIVVSKRSGLMNIGHARLEAAKLNQWKKCPVDFQDFDSEADEYANMVADNKIAELAQTDLSMVNKEFINFGPDFDLDLLGVPNFQMNVFDLLKVDDTKKKEINGDVDRTKYYLQIEVLDAEELKKLYDELSGRGFLVKVISG